MLPEEIQADLAAMGQPVFHAKQIFRWLAHGVRSFGEMTDLSKPLREQLEEIYSLNPPNVLRKQISKVDGTVKYLWGLADGNSVESVVMWSCTG